MPIQSPKYPPRMPARERREQILDVTLHMLAELGFDALSIESVAKSAEITRPTVYGFFDDLPALLNALVDREEQRALSQIVGAIPAIASGSDPDDVLVNGLKSFLAAVHDSPDTWRLILLPSEGLPRQIRQRINTRREDVIAQLDRLVEWGIARRGGPQDVDSNLLARLIVGFAQETARLTLSDPEQFSITRMTRFAHGLVHSVAGGTPDTGRQPPPFDVLPPIA